MFLWNIETGAVADFFTQQPYVAPEGMQSPIGSKMAAGLVEGNENAFWFDYNSGAQTISSQARVQFFPEMPEDILKTSPMSLWNVALELHTGRIFEHLIGPFYILIVPIAGICILLVLISGVMVESLPKNKRQQINCYCLLFTINSELSYSFETLFNMFCWLFGSYKRKNDQYEN
jgi:hypothetical protein